MTGSALGQFGVVVIGLVGIFSLFRARRHRGRIDEDAESRITRQVEMERRMASYLAARYDTKMEGARDDRR
ncbi:MAG: hypothetical protein C0524_11605 [Rhodobacter sp.]|nr:hypothetical protein [Rhodobacter sp.]